MKSIILILLLLPNIASAQTKADYDNMMMRFGKYYNAQEYDSIVINLFPNKSKYDFRTYKLMIQDAMPMTGKLLSYQYIGVDSTDPNLVAVSKTKWVKAGSKITSFNIDKGGGFGTFRLLTMSDGIKQMLAAQKKRP